MRNPDGSLSLFDFEIRAWRSGRAYPKPRKGMRAETACIVWEWVPNVPESDLADVVIKPPPVSGPIVRVGPDPLAKYRFGARS